MAASNDLDKKCLFDYKATEFCLFNGCNARIKVCTFAEVSLSKFICIKIAFFKLFGDVERFLSADSEKKVNNRLTFCLSNVKKLRKWVRNRLECGSPRPRMSTRDMLVYIIVLTEVWKDSKVDKVIEKEFELLCGLVATAAAGLVEDFRDSNHIDCVTGAQPNEGPRTTVNVDANVDDQNAKQVGPVAVANNSDNVDADVDEVRQNEALCHRLNNEPAKVDENVDDYYGFEPFWAAQRARVNLFLNFRHKKSLLNKWVRESQDIELNPGPRPTLAEQHQQREQQDQRNQREHGNQRDQPVRRDQQDRRDQADQERPDGREAMTAEQSASTVVKTYNVRGLNDERKLRHLLSSFQKELTKNRDFVANLQETYIRELGKIPYIWRGNYHLTPGNGNSVGCLTLLSSHLSIIAHRDIGSRAHVLALQKAGENGVKYITANVYAPNVNNDQKSSFLEEVFDTVLEFGEAYDCQCFIISGDLNVVLKPSEAKNRLILATEKKMAEFLVELSSGAGLADVWENKSEYTWHRPNSDIFSTIDRILYSKQAIKMLKVNVDWALSLSDHAMLTCYLLLNDVKPIAKSRIARLDPSLMKDEAAKAEIITELNDLMSMAPPSWNPHLKLEYLKMSIRTVLEKAQASRKRKEKSEEEFLNEELDKVTKVLANSNNDVGNLASYIEELRDKKRELIDKKGERLAERLGTKWYNEGEKSTRYFLRLLNRSMPDAFRCIVDEDGQVHSDELAIEKKIVEFYKKLYENYETSASDDGDNEFFDNIEMIPDANGDMVAARITIEDLKSTLDTCTDSTPGPDGIPYSVIKEIWHLFGPILCEAWNYSISTKSLPPSHKLSYLKLIPKADKDSKLLKNWRPITLSNCDHKIVTKTYSRRMCEAVEAAIKGRQTAYLKGRLINDNLRGIIASIKTANNEDNIDGLIISLDAKKAFDSVEHKYIEECLTKFGLSAFVPIFKLLYTDLKSDIIINGRIVDGFLIKRGVKQGDALSCVLFILCMEPLLRNIEANDEIRPIRSANLNADLPKVYAYADDVNGVIENTRAGAQALFNEYERLSKKSGLELNADKTEVLRIKSARMKLLKLRIRYLDKDYEIDSCEMSKINGVLIQQDERKMKASNVRAIIGKMESALKRWSRRSLSSLGKILILKTYGISQVIYLLQTLTIDNVDVKLINSMLYKFLWNRHFLAPKAPERLKREIVNKPISQGGLGMLDLTELDGSLKLRALGRLLVTAHPFLMLIKNKLNLSEFFYPSCATNYDGITNVGLELLGKDRRGLIQNEDLEGNRTLIGLLKELKLKRVVRKGSENSITVFNLARNGCNKVRHLNRRMLGMIRPIVDRALYDRLVKIEPLPNVETPEEIKTSYCIKTCFINLSKLTSKEIRLNRSNKEPICLYKVGLILTPNESINWLDRVRKLTSTKLKDTIIRIAHGEIYTKEKLHRYGLVDSPTCLRCNEDENETLSHKFFTCRYVRAIWRHTLLQTNKLRINGIDLSNINFEDPDVFLAARTEDNLTIMTIHAEILRRILSLKDAPDHLIHPRIITQLAIKHLIRREGNRLVKEQLKTLLND